MKTIFLKLFVVGLLFMFCNTELMAQDSTIVDSTEESIDSLIAPKSLGDTVINRYEFKTDDSMQAYKMSKDFAYMRYLDSLLRKTKDLSVDTFSVSDGSVRRSRRVSQNTGQVRIPANIFGSPVVKIILWILAVVLISFIIWKLFVGENFFRRSLTYKNISGKEKEEEELTDASAYDKLIAQAVANKNYRLAIRYLYLQTLQKLTESGLLQFAADKTNYQYVNELRGKPCQNDFAAITLNYEYVWYGKFEIGEDVYRRLSGDYKSFQQKV
jgi:hypothetical protein